MTDTTPAPSDNGIRHTACGESAAALEPGALFDRVAAIIDGARTSVVRAVNSHMVIAYWLIGREIVAELQGGEERAEYGDRLITELSSRLTECYGGGFSTTNLKMFRTFYSTYRERLPQIGHTLCDESEMRQAIGHTACDESLQQKRHTCVANSSEGDEGPQLGIRRRMLDAVETLDSPRGFSPLLSWSHYRELMKVEHRGERLFYEIEAGNDGWSVRQLRRQIQSFLFARLLKSRDKEGVLELAREGLTVRHPVDAIKDPYVLDFLDLPESTLLHEAKMEGAIISNLQQFLLELGKGFAFVARQKRMTFEDEFFYVDLVFYHCILKCYVLIDLKVGGLTHQDVGQMDGYVRMWDDRFRAPDDNPTIGLILCSEKNETIARYSVLKKSRQLFASKYRLHLPTEDELAAELKREILAIREGGRG